MESGEFPGHLDISWGQTPVPYVFVERAGVPTDAAFEIDVPGQVPDCRLTSLDLPVFADDLYSSALPLAEIDGT